MYGFFWFICYVRKSKAKIHQKSAIIGQVLLNIELNLRSNIDFVSVCVFDCMRKHKCIHNNVYEINLNNDTLIIFCENTIYEMK